MGYTENNRVIHTEKGAFLQSYGAIVAFRPKDGPIQLDSWFWDYLGPVGKFRNQFLNCNKWQAEHRIAIGVYVFADLNCGERGFPGIFNKLP